MDFGQDVDFLNEKISVTGKRIRALEYCLNIATIGSSVPTEMPSGEDETYWELVTKFSTSLSKEQLGELLLSDLRVSTYLTERKIDEVAISALRASTKRGRGNILIVQLYGGHY
jgi:RNase H-fold protein (predicted Holliday junction resolvase)